MVTTQPQINLDLTHWVTNSENNAILQHDCLHVAVPIETETDPQQIISYCMSEWPSEWIIQPYSFDQKFTFADLAKLSITSEQLYIWSASVDIIESYQFYLDQRSTSKELLSMPTDIFYNCTSPTFGPLCQYSLDGYEFDNSSVEDIFHDYYTYPYRPMTMTCYTHLQCNLGSNPVCLDWRNICDGQIDCSNDDIDEKYCWELQINECQDDEYRCKDGQCIPKTFLMEGNYADDCIDGSNIDANRWVLPNSVKKEPTFVKEDSRCLKLVLSQLPFISSCAAERAPDVLKAMFYGKLDSISDDCWFAFRCYFSIPDSSHPRCRDICANETCQNIINRTCPDILFIPNTPIYFGHIYFAYTKADAVQSMIWMLPPSYICYNDQLCNAFLPNSTLLLFNNLTCRQPQHFPVKFFQGARGGWMDTYMKPIYQQLYKCNTIPYTIATICNTASMYQCVNSSKCISKDRVGDGIRDCNYEDDEQQDVINRVCSNDRSGKFFNCTTTKKCINRRQIENGYCDCEYDEYGVCDDENLYVRHITTHLSFPTICDGFIELIPVNISGRYETDETECELWHCNNTYTRCDGFWNCFDGADEVNCDPSPLLNCPLQHICISSKTTQLICLSLAKVNDGVIDCLGAIDERNLCRSSNFKRNEIDFYCKDDYSHTCTWSQYSCDEIKKCSDETHTWFCIPSRNITISDYKCDLMDRMILSDLDQFLCMRKSETFKPLRRSFFSLDIVEKSTDDITPTTTVPSSPIKSMKQRCQRGFPLRVWLDRENNLTNTTCLCPPSYYGDICQYQNQRVSLTVKLLAYSDSRRTLFAVVTSLIDDDDKRTIHSHQQFTYLYIRDCKIKLNIYLLYSTRTKNDTKHYSIHIDVYEKISLIHRGSFLVPVKFLFLPIQRIAAQINISRADESIQSCSNQPCIHGRCAKYSNDAKNTTFCQCQQGWSGRYCNIPHTCSCSPGSLCIGISANNRAICVCPINKFGRRCLLHNIICQSNANETCYNGGECIPMDEHMTSEKKYFCICPKSYTGNRCEIPNTKIMVSFHENITLPQSMMVHFIQIVQNNIPNNGSTFVTISVNNKSAFIYWSHPFHISFIKLFENSYYLLIVQKTYNASITMYRTINPSDRCAYISEVFNESITQLHLLRRIKYYHLPCQNHSSYLSCFYDDTHFCLCTDFGYQRVVNCFEFNYTKKFDCFGQSGCLNGAECLQDRPTCPLISICVCPTCFYGAQCQFSSDGFAFSLDGILGYHIQPHVNTIHQPGIVQISVALTIIMSTAGLVDGVLSMITFNNQNLRKNGCGQYLLGSSITTLLLTVIFAMKFTILLIAQINYISNRSFLKVQCISIDFLLRVGLNMVHWLNACVAIERAIVALQGIRFSQKKSQQMAKYVIIFLLLFTTSTTIHDALNRRLINDGDDSEEKRIWCIVTYSSALHSFNSTMNILHFVAPFIANIISAGMIILITTRQRRTTHNQESYRNLLYKQIREHKHLLIAPFILIILAIPRLIISLVSGCMKSSDDAWLFLVGYFISFVPSMLTFVVFVLPSKMYREEFWHTIKRYKSHMKSRLGIDP